MPAIPDRRSTVLALHGFTLGGAMFDELAQLVDADLVAPDLPGHGGRDGSGCSWDEAVAEVLGLVGRHRPDVVMGYSMGGRLALAAALESTLPFGAVLVSTGVGIADAAARTGRQQADDALATDLETMALEEFLARWESNEQLSGHAELASVRRANSSAGLAAALRGMGQGAQPYFGYRLGTMDQRTVWLAGELDETYAAIARGAAAATPNASVTVLPDVRHNVVAEVPEAVAAAVSEFLASRRSA